MYTHNHKQPCSTWKRNKTITLLYMLEKYQHIVTPRTLCQWEQAAYRHEPPARIFPLYRNLPRWSLSVADYLQACGCRAEIFPQQIFPRTRFEARPSAFTRFTFPKPHPPFQNPEGCSYNVNCDGDTSKEKFTFADELRNQFLRGTAHGARNSN